MLPLLALLVDFTGTLVVLGVSVGCLRDYLRPIVTPERRPCRTRTTSKTLAAIIALRFFLGRALKARIAPALDHSATE